MFLRQYLQVRQVRQLGHVGIGNEVRKKKHNGHASKARPQETQSEFPVGSRVSRFQVVQVLDRPPHVTAALTRRLVSFDGVAESKHAEVAIIGEGRKAESRSHLRHAQILGMFRCRETH